MTHPPLDTFGDPARAAADPHVRSCAQCQADLAVQREVHELLAALPDPGPVPPDVVDRISATLAQLARTPEDAVPLTTTGATGSTGSTASTPSTAGAEPASAASTVVPISQAPTARRRRPVLAAAAAAAVLVGGGYVVSQVLPGGTSADGGAASSALQDRSQQAPKSAELAQVPVIASGTDYTEKSLEQQLDPKLGAQQSQGLGADDAAGGAEGDLGQFATPAGIAGCLSALGAPGAVPQLVDVARFEGKPAAVIVLPSDDGGREIWVVATTCRPGQDGMKFFRAVR